VAVIGQLDPEKPMGETWVRIWSPPGVRGFLHASSVTSLPSAEDGAALWSAALTAASRDAPEFVSPRERVARQGPQGKGTGARDELDRARLMLAAEQKKETPDYGSVRQVLEGVVTDKEAGPVAIEARMELEKLSNLEETARLRDELRRERMRREAAAIAAQKKVWEKSTALDPLRGVFLSRGTVQRRVGTDGTKRFFLHFGGQTRAELLCSSRRYDLERFEGYLVGVQGKLGGELEPGVNRIELVRLEVLERRL